MPAKRAPAAAAEKNAVVNVALEVGDWIDVMDSEGTWNVAQILSFPNAKEVEVKYDGWGAEYNEVLPLNGERVAPYHTYTWSVKCWAKYKNWPWWPSIVTIRSPGTEAGQTYLTTETRLFVDFLDRKDFTKRCRCWVDLNNIKPFDDHFDDRRKRTSGTDFETSLTMALKSSASIKFPPFSEGTLPREFERAIADPVKALKKSLGMRKWAGFFNSNLSRHRKVYMYKSNKTSAGEEDDDDDDDDDDLVIQFHDLSESDDDEKPKRPRSKGSGKGPLKKARTDTKATKSTALHTAAPEPVVVVEDSAAIIEGPHAPSPSDEPEEPIYLPALDDQIESDAPSVPSDTKAPIDPSETALETVSDDLSKNAESGESEKSIDRRAEPGTIDTNAQADSVGDTERNEMISSEGSEIRISRTAIASTHMNENAHPREDEDANDEEGDDDFGIDTGCGDDGEANTDLDPHAQAAPPRTADTKVSGTVNGGGDEDGTRVGKNHKEPSSSCDISALSSSRGKSGGTGKSSETSHLKALSPTEEVLRRISESLLEIKPSVENDSHESQPGFRKRKLTKSLVDESIAAAQAALTEKEDRTPGPKRARSTRSAKQTDVAVVASAKNASDKGGEDSNEVHSTNSTPPHPTIATVAPIDGGVPQSKEKDTSRRSSMRAGAKGKDSRKNSRSQGKTPVWVLPPPKFDSAVQNKSNGNFRATVPVLPPPFSSLSLFHSPRAFSLNKWFKCSEPMAK